MPPRKIGTLVEIKACACLGPALQVSQLGSRLAESYRPLEYTVARPGERLIFLA